MITEIIVCSLILSPQPVDIKDFQHCMEQEEKIEHVSKWMPLVKRYFPTDQIKTALLVIYCESRGVSSATNHNTNSKGVYKNSKDRGLFQINSITFDWAREKLGVRDEPYNPYIGAYISAWIVKHFDWAWWSSSEHCWGTS